MHKAGQSKTHQAAHIVKNASIVTKFALHSTIVQCNSFCKRMDLIELLSESGKALRQPKRSHLIQFFLLVLL